MTTETRVFIDGSHGTTGLELENRLKKHPNINILTIDPEKRKDDTEKQKIFDQADVIFLCLPDQQAIKSVSMISPDKIVLDASTAHRTNPAWTYGFPELSKEHRQAVEKSKRICVPGCHATGFIGIVYPLVKQGLLPADGYLSCFSITGYSGGGKEMIARYQDSNRRLGDSLGGPQPYALAMNHKHLPEMKLISEIKHNPHFVPVVGDVERGMLVTVPIYGDLKLDPNQVISTLNNHYAGNDFVKIHDLENNRDISFLDPTGANFTNNIEIFVFGHMDQITITARLDNLGKGSSGAAVQCMNIALGLNEKIGLVKK